MTILAGSAQPEFHPAAPDFLQRGVHRRSTCVKASPIDVRETFQPFRGSPNARTGAAARVIPQRGSCVKCRCPRKALDGAVSAVDFGALQVWMKVYHGTPSLEVLLPCDIVHDGRDDGVRSDANPLVCVRGCEEQCAQVAMRGPGRRNGDRTLPVR